MPAHIDTLAYYEQLRAAGNNELEAKAHVYSLNNVVSDLATKDDLENSINKLSIKIGLIEKIGSGFGVAILMLLLKVALWP